MIPESGLVLGVDVGWAAQKKTTGACVLEWTATDVRVVYARHGSSLADTLTGHGGDGPILALAVDGPVRGALDEIGVYRNAEQMLTRGFAKIGKPGQSSSGNGKRLNAAANAIVKLVLATGRLAVATHAAKIHEHAFVEAFPTTFLGVMLDERGVPSHGARSDAYFQYLLGPNSGTPPPPTNDRLLGLLARLLPGRRPDPSHFGDLRDHEDRAAVICALTALCVVARSYVAVGDAVNGYIVLPPRAEAGEPGLQPWAWTRLEANRPAGAEAAIVVE